VRVEAAPAGQPFRGAVRPPSLVAPVPRPGRAGLLTWAPPGPWPGPCAMLGACRRRDTRFRHHRRRSGAQDVAAWCRAGAARILVSQASCPLAALWPARVTGRRFG
jgi:hypothetical protein